MSIKRAGLIFVGAALAAVLLVRASGGAQATEADLDYERTTASNALAMLEQQVAQQPVPDRVEQWLDKGRRHTERLLAVDDPERAHKHFRKATTAFERISRFLRQSEPEAEDDSALTPAQRLQRMHERLGRMNRRMAQLQRRAERESVTLDFAPAAALAAAAQEALVARDLRTARANLRELKDALLGLQDALVDALEQEGGQ